MKTSKESNGVATILHHMDQDESPVFEAKKDGELKEIVFKVPLKESGADELINPGSFTGQGLDSEEYNKVNTTGLCFVIFCDFYVFQIRSKDEIRDLVTKAQINIDSVDFDRVFEEASENESTGCSISSFLNTRKQLLNNS